MDEIAPGCCINDAESRDRNPEPPAESDSREVVLKYGSHVINRFRTFIAMPVLAIALCLLLNIHHPGYLSLLVLSLFLLFLYYRYRICRQVAVSENGVRETVAGRTWIWRYSEIDTVTELKVTGTGSEPGRRMILEHETSLDVSIDDQMTGYDEAVGMIRDRWTAETSRRIDTRSVGYFLLKYW